MVDKDDTTLVISNDGEMTEIPVSMQLYQAMYHNITGKTEKITDTYDRCCTITLSDVINLESRIKQFCEQYHIKEANASITIFHIKGSKERFSSFERLNAYNVANTNPVERINIEINFLIVLPNVNKPQNYKVIISLVSGIAVLEKHENDAPKILPIELLMNAVKTESAEIAIEYVDYIVARGLSDLFREWHDSLSGITPSRTTIWWQSKSHIVRIMLATVFFLMAVFFSAQYTEQFLVPGAANLVDLAKFLIYASASIIIVGSLGNLLGRRIERSIDSIRSNSFSIIQVNAGDKILINKHEEKRRRSKKRVFIEGISTFGIGLCSSLLASYLMS